MVQLLEQHDSEVQHNVLFSPMENRATYNYFLKPEHNPRAGPQAECSFGGLTTDDMQDVLTQVLGTTYLFGSGREPDGSLKRALPLAHPIWPWLTAGKINNLRAAGGNRGNPIFPASPSIEGVPAAVEEYRQPDTYEIGVEFDLKPYQVLPDRFIPIRFRFDPNLTKSNNWFSPTTGYVQVNDPNLAAVPGSDYIGDYDPVFSGRLRNPIRFTYAPEWCRYVEFSTEILGDTVSVNGGTMEFKSAAGGVNNVRFPAPIKQFLPDAIVRLKWHQVPLRYLTSKFSVFQAFVGRINQFPWPNFQDFPYLTAGVGPLSQPDPTSWNKYKNALPQFAAGSLLMLPIKIHRYRAPRFPSRFLDGTERLGFETLYPQLMDIEMEFLYTTRRATLPFAAINNTNFVTNGWNSVPWYITRRFYYAETTVPPASNNPLDHNARAPGFFSVPFEMLFCDPDCPDNIWTDAGGQKRSVILSNLPGLTPGDGG